MRIFIDCTYTANNTYKNTGIHRVVRQITAELIQIAKNKSNLEVFPVRFDGRSITEVTSLQETVSSLSLKGKSLSSYIHRAKNKLKKILLHYLPIKKRVEYAPEFLGIPFSSSDVYLIADANWDLPSSYYHFLQHLRSHNVSIVSICYDLIPIKFPEFCPKEFVNSFSAFYRQYSDCFDQVICISNKSAEDYIKAKQDGILPNNNKRQIVSSFRLGSDYSKKQKLDANSLNDNSNVTCDPNFLSLLNQRYILVVGSLVPHKNIKTIVAAFDLLTKSNNNVHNVHLVFAGNRGWHNDADLLVEKNKMYGNLIHILDSVTDSQLDILYKNCYCLVQASFYEGFGLPVVEALQHGKPVISSNGGSLPEVGEDFCMYFDPTQPDQLHQSLEKLLASDEFYNQIVVRIKNEYRAFSWKESSEQLLSLLLLQ